MEILLKVELTRVIGTPQGREEVAQAFIERIPTRGGLEVGLSGYEIMSVTHEE